MCTSRSKPSGSTASAPVVAAAPLPIAVQAPLAPGAPAGPRAGQGQGGTRGQDGIRGGSSSLFGPRMRIDRSLSRSGIGGAGGSGIRM